MTRPTLAKLRERREAADAAAATAYAELLNRVLELADAPNANVTAIALEAGIARATVYNELGRRQDMRETLEARPPVPPAPADDEPGERKRRHPFTLIQTQVLEALAGIQTSAGTGLRAGARVERITDAVNGYRGPKGKVSERRVRGILRELADVASPPVEAVEARRGGTNYRLTDAELARRAERQAVA